MRAHRFEMLVAIAPAHADADGRVELPNIAAAQNIHPAIEAIRSLLTSSAATAKAPRIDRRMGYRVGGRASDSFGGISANRPQTDARHDMLRGHNTWVERHHAIARIVTTQMTPPLRCHPLCTYPSAVRYADGDIDGVASVGCGNKATQQ